ncbi:MAG: type II secretion system GspH family protein [Myxococcota bacterium]|nr:type II secretion system GspH family protein [Myxococcota bacterium]MDW8360819.1 prepilin-type N-terminal cleavage/methylation domain-containing protein [Myxococcales bacterium]
MTPTRRAACAARASRAGMTLVEILVVVAILGLVAGGVGFGLGALGRSQQRSAAMRVAAAARFAYGRAHAQGTTVRLVLDLDRHTLALEEAHGRVVLAAASDRTRQRLDEHEAARAAVDPWEAARARLERTLDPSFGESPFGPLTDAEGRPLRRFAARSVSRSGEVRLRRLYVAHEPVPRETGRGAVHFFPGGRAEHAVVWIGLHGSDRVLSVEIHPLTGRATIHEGAYEPPDADRLEEQAPEPVS